ncbi:MAG: sigma-70 family RNA polymerase sigma factor [Anaerolineales bacterium]|nr:sigma-70 family RNA polymerase sigma factor [Anaerolineales bacterium]
MLPKPDFTQLVEVHSREIYAFLWRMLQDTKDAEDCLQDTYLRAFKAYGRLNPDSNYRAWLYKIAANVARTALKKRSRFQNRNLELDPEKVAGGANLESTLDNQISLQIVKQAVEALPFKQQSCLLLRKYQGLSYAEIGSVLDCSEESVRANVYQAVKKLRNILVIQG